MGGSFESLGGFIVAGSHRDKNHRTTPAGRLMPYTFSCVPTVRFIESYSQSGYSKQGYSALTGDQSSSWHPVVAKKRYNMTAEVCHLIFHFGPACGLRSYTTGLGSS